MSEIGVTLDFASPDDPSSSGEGSYIADFDFEPGEDIESWPATSWKWANGAVSTDPCGMPSAGD